MNRKQTAEPEGTPWGRPTRIAFRFSLVYLGLFGLASQVAGSLFLIPGVSFRGIGPLWPMRQITTWIAVEVFGATSEFDMAATSGETIFFWAQLCWLFALAVLATLIWSMAARHRPDHRTLHAWLRLGIRLGLASQMFEYGMTKIIPTQFEAPSLNILVTPVGDLSLNTLLWTSVGASPAYQVFTGWAELLGGALLLVPSFTLAGALICLADLTHVFVLNMTYDIGLKLTSLHLILFAVFLVAPDSKRLSGFFFQGHPTPPQKRFEPLRTVRANRIAVALQIVLGVYLVGIQAWANVAFWYAEGGGAPTSALYGIWNVETLAVDGESRPAGLNDYDRRWRRVIFDGPGTVTIQRTDDSFARYGALVDTGNSSLALDKGGSRNWRAEFEFRRPIENRLILDGEMDGYTVYAELERVEFDTFRLLNSHFRWLRPANP